MMSIATARLRLAAISLVAGAPLGIAACGNGATGKITVASAPKPAHWGTLVHATRPLDLVGPRADGSLVLAAAGRLSILSRTGPLGPFPSVQGAYRSPGGEEPYIALSPGGCFGPGTVYALRLTSGRGVVAIGARGGVHRFARLAAPGLIDGIAFDSTGGFGHKLLVTINAGARTTVDAIGCGDTVTTITRTAPRVEGGVAVAPKSFGRFAGDLIAPSETSGQIFAVTPTGRSLLLANSGLPHGNDIGVESEGFVPSGSADAFVADRLTPGNPHPGDDAVLHLPAAALRAAGVRPGDLLVATEGAGLTEAVSCSAAGCRVRLVAQGPALAHVEGHIAFSRSG
jgi:hypothetical protein